MNDLWLQLGTELTKPKTIIGSYFRTSFTSKFHSQTFGGGSEHFRITSLDISKSIDAVKYIDRHLRSLTKLLARVCFKEIARKSFSLFLSKIFIFFACYKTSQIGLNATMRMFEIQFILIIDGLQSSFQFRILSLVHNFPTKSIKVSRKSY